MGLRAELDEVKIELSIQKKRHLEDIEEELGLENITTEDLRKLGDKLKHRMHTIADALKILEKHGWRWTTGAKDIHLFKDVSVKEAESEIKKLYLDKSLIHFDWRFKNNKKSRNIRNFNRCKINIF